MAHCGGSAAGCRGDVRSRLEGRFSLFYDQNYVTANPHVLTGLNRANLIWGATSVKYFRQPLCWWSLMLDAQIFGDRAPGFHLTNLAWHCCSVLVLFAALTRMTGDLWPSALTAGLFAVHPLNVESVAWIAERKGVISTCFWMLTILAYARYAAKPGPGRYLATLLALVLGLMAKPMLVTLTIVLLLLDFWPLSRMGTVRDPGMPAGPSAGTPFGAGITARRLGRLVAEKLPLLLVAIVFSGVTIVAQERGGTLHSGEKLVLSSRLKNAALSYVIDLKQAVLPVDLAAFYPHPAATLKTGPAVAAAFTIAALTLATLRCRRRARYLMEAASDRLLDVLAVRFMVLADDDRPPKPSPHCRLIRMASIPAPGFGRGRRYFSNRCWIWENADALPRAFVVGLVRASAAPGKHKVVFTYYPRGLRLGLAISLMTALAMTIVALGVQGERR